MLRTAGFAGIPRVYEHTYSTDGTGNARLRAEVPLAGAVGGGQRRSGVEREPGSLQSDTCATVLLARAAI